MTRCPRCCVPLTMTVKAGCVWRVPYRATIEGHLEQAGFL